MTVSIYLSNTICYFWPSCVSWPFKLNFIYITLEKYRHIQYMVRSDIGEIHLYPILVVLFEKVIVVFNKQCI